MFMLFFQAIKEDGENPDEYLVVPLGGSAKVVPKKSVGKIIT